MASELPEVAPATAPWLLQLRQRLARVNVLLKQADNTEGYVATAREELAHVWEPLTLSERETSRAEETFKHPWEMVRMSIHRGGRTPEQIASNVMWLTTLLAEATDDALQQGLEVKFSTSRAAPGVAVYQRTELASFTPTSLGFKNEDDFNEL